MAEYIVKARIDGMASERVGRYATIKQAMRAGRAAMESAIHHADARIYAEDDTGFRTMIARASAFSGWIML